MKIQNILNKYNETSSGKYLFSRIYRTREVKNNSEVQKPTPKCDSIVIFSHFQI